MTNEPKGQRRPRPEDLEPVLERLWEGKSLAAACKELGLHAPSTSAWLDSREESSADYARAREGRAEHLMETGLTVAKAAALNQTFEGEKIDPAGARVFLEATKFTIGRMSSRSSPVTRIAVSFEDMPREERLAKIAQLQEKLLGSDGAGGD